MSTCKPLRLWEIREATESLKFSLQVSEQVETIVKNNELPLELLPHSVIETKDLYFLAVNYEMLYKKLQDLELLNTANLRPSKTLN